MSTADEHSHYIRPLGKIKAPRPPRAGRRARWHTAILLFGAILLGACAMGPRLEPVTAPAETVITLTDGTVRWTVLPNTWSAYPNDLARYFTPIQVRIENARSDELQIRYDDFVALDDTNQQYRAVPPGEVARAVSGALAPAGNGSAPGLVRLAGPWYYPYRPRYWAPYYGPWWYADPSSYPYAWPWPGAQDVLTLGLREGRVLAGASVQGFVFLQHATARGAFLTVLWTPRLANGETVPALSARFRIAR